MSSAESQYPDLPGYEIEWLDERGEPAPHGRSGFSGVYFLHDPEERAVKVGSAEDINGRLSQLQIGNARPLVFLGWIPGGLTEERKIGRSMQEQRIGRSEWYRVTPEILGMIREACEAQRLLVRERRLAWSSWVKSQKGASLRSVARREGVNRARGLGETRPLLEVLEASVQMLRPRNR